MDENNRLTSDHPGHETTDINVWAVGKFGIALIAITLISLALLFGLMRYFQSRETTEVVKTVDPPKAFSEGVLLQTTPVADLRRFREGEEKVLNSYGWVDQSKGVVRIPIEQAIDILAKRGLPSRKEAGK
jgi:hypothetical protein